MNGSMMVFNVESPMSRNTAMQTIQDRAKTESHGLTSRPRQHTRRGMTKAMHQNVEARPRQHLCCLEARLLPRDIHAYALKHDYLGL